MEYMIIAIDGPAGVGKGTIAKRLANHYRYTYIDSGMYYRAVAFLTLQNHFTLEDQSAIVKIAESMQISYKEEHIYLNDVLIKNDLRSPEVNHIVAEISCIEEVRLAINSLIKEYAKNKNIIIDGRDTTSVIFPNAQLKIFLTASLEARTKRRYLQNKIRFSIEDTMENVSASIKKRDAIEKQKTYGRLEKAIDVIEIDTTNKTEEETVLEIIKIIEGE